MNMCIVKPVKPHYLKIKLKTLRYLGTSSYDFKLTSIYHDILDIQSSTVYIVYILHLKLDVYIDSKNN